MSSALSESGDLGWRSAVFLLRASLIPSRNFQVPSVEELATWKVELLGLVQQLFQGIAGVRASKHMALARSS